MDGWLGVGVAVLAVVTVLLVPLAMLAARRRWLARQGGTFECCLRLRPVVAPGGGWVFGMARYNGGLLEWFRFFSYSYGPRMRFLRSEVQVLHSRQPDPAEAESLYAGQQIVRIQVRREGQDQRGQPEEWDLAMSGDSLTGLLSWLESAPPGVGSYGLAAS